MEAYIDDMMVKIEDFVNHMNYLKEVFEVIRSHRMKLNPKKCVFEVTSGKLLGYLVSIRGIKSNTNKIQALINMRSSLGQKGIQ